MGRNLSLQTRRRNARGINKRVQGPWRGRKFFGLGNRATLTTAIAGNNNDLLYVAKVPGTAGNSIRVRYVVSGNNTPLSVSVAGNDITVNSATDGSAAATSTAADVKKALQANAAVNALVTVSNVLGNDNTGVIAALAYTNLAGAS